MFSVKKKNLANLLFIFVLFPYVSPMDTFFDTQPFALVISIFIFLLFLFTKNERAIKQIWWLLFLFLFSIISLLFFSKDFMNGFRSLFGYATLFFVTFSSYKTFKYISPKILLNSTFIWLFFGIVQSFISKDFGSFILPRLSTSAARGVTSLAVEPSYYAIMMIFMLIFNEYFFKLEYFSKKEYISVVILCSLQMLLTLSGMGILLLSVFILAKGLASVLTQNFVKKISAITVLLSIMMIGYFAFLNIPILSNSRGGLLFYKLLNNPIDVIYTDASFSQRLSHILIPIISVFQSFGFGFGVGNFEYYLKNLSTNLPHILLSLFSNIVIRGNRIMSGWGSSIFELGVAGLIPMLIFTNVSISSKQKNLRQTNIICFIVIFIVMWNAVPYSLPTFAYLLGMLSFLKFFWKKDSSQVTFFSSNQKEE